jgi:hypothetical protein
MDPLMGLTLGSLADGRAVMPDFTFAGRFQLDFDVPDSITEFRLRWSPVPVPEPTMLTLASHGWLSLLFYGRRRGGSLRSRDPRSRPLDSPSPWP